MVRKSIVPESWIRKAGSVRRDKSYGAQENDTEYRRARQRDVQGAPPVEPSAAFRNLEKPPIKAVRVGPTAAV